jgi:hypothetical protein
MKFSKYLEGALCLAQVACASHPSSIAGTYVNDNQYSSWDCDKLLKERTSVTARARDIAQDQQETADKDQALIAAGLLIAWPALFAVGMTGNHEKEFADIKGQYEAIDRVEQSKNCPLPDSAKAPLYTPPPPPETRLKPGHA